ncbi:HAMP domain-containing sensor histidine kinase [Roseimicrobium sp. ORNL1]|uniref:sensor histidine kinase n=1 Tax=Roseimicrobium sp. ORNL1 TaxID=2711231 RepID=UPI0013E1BAB1|nr:HAMP domain-containing sensor histidine kinase [Roseimicrobium sp. ORNL1]QIF05685.1 HAMP domain-containing histidine kinase [Roseimicrobium sp. ORNL1]
MKAFHKSLRWRIQAGHAIILLVVLVAFGGTAYWLVRENNFKRLDAELQRRITAVVAGIGPPPALGWEPGFRLQREHRTLFEDGGPGSYYYLVISASGKTIASSPNAPANVPVPAFKDASSDPVVRQRGEFREFMLLSTRPMPPGLMGEQKGVPRVLAPPNRSSANPMVDPPSMPSTPRFRFPLDANFVKKFFPQTMVVVGCSIAPVQAELRHLAWGFTVAGAAVIFLGVATGWHFSGRAIKPIGAISHAARVVAGGNLSERIKIKDATSELGELAGVLNETFTRLQSAFARQAQFTADASHELRTPTFVILLQAQAALKRERSAEEYREALSVCQMAAQQMKNLVNSLLILARQDAPTSEIHRVPCAVDEIVTESASLLRSLAAERNVQVHLDLKSAMALGDPTQLKQVIANLLVNAIEYNRPGGEVKLAVFQDTTGVVFVVSDTGVGISSRDLPHVFDRFYRADNSRSSAEGHTGLGLSICKAIIESHRGTITVASELGKGTTFTVMLPLVPHSETDTEASADPSLRNAPYAITPSITLP